MATLSILSIAPNAGSTDGGTEVTVTGNGFAAGAAVILDSVRHAASVERTTALRFTTTAHAPGPVDLVVVNPGDQTAQLAGGFTYAAARSFDFNGTWKGVALAHPELAGRLGARHSDMDLWLVIQGDTLTEVVCADYSVVMVRPPRVADGAFAATTSDGAAVTGRIVSPTTAVGTSTPRPARGRGGRRASSPDRPSDHQITRSPIAR